MLCGGTSIISTLPDLLLVCWFVSGTSRGALMIGCEVCAVCSKGRGWTEYIGGFCTGCVFWGCAGGWGGCWLEKQ